MNSIVINSKQLSAAVKALAPIAAKGYFTDILLEVESNTATITATSLDVTAKKTIELPFANSANFATLPIAQTLPPPSQANHLTTCCKNCPTNS